MLRRSGDRRTAFTLVATLLAVAPRPAVAQDMSSPLPPRTSVGAGLGLAVRNDDPFAALGACAGRSSGLGSAALDVGVRLSRWLSAEVTGSKHFSVGEPIACPNGLVLPRLTGADTLSRVTRYPGRDQRAFTVRLAAVPAHWRHASVRLFAGVAHVEPTGRTGATIGGALSAGGMVRARLEVEQWLLPTSRDVQDVFYVDGREVGRRDRVERAVAQPMFVRLGIQIIGR